MDLTVDELRKKLKEYETLVEYLEVKASLLDEHGRSLEFRYSGGNYVTFAYTYNDGDTDEYDYSLDDLLAITPETSAEFRARELEKKRLAREAQLERSRKALEERERAQLRTLMAKYGSKGEEV